jgi:sulfoxide reductase heme-binding subunit YedZ
MRKSHATLAILAIVLAGIHAAMFLFLADDDGRLRLVTVTIPLLGGGKWRWALGIVGLETMIAVAVSSAWQRFFVYRRWLHFHWFSYPAVALVVVHAWLGAAANGHLATLWLAGLTVLVPTALIVILRFVPTSFLAALGLLTEESHTRGEEEPAISHNHALARAATTISVDNQRCNLYGICQTEAPNLFELTPAGRLRYVSHVTDEYTDQARAAARTCPMRAIHLSGEQRI